tara:strand:+ start:689 stop:982 length:294 start_codon:yes stop_codon:yes gene_type:complete
MLYDFKNKEQVEIVVSAEDKTKEQHMQDYIKSLKTIEDCMEPFKEQKKDLREEYDENGWLSKEDQRMAVKAYRLLKKDVDIGQLIDMYEALRGRHEG